MYVCVVSLKCVLDRCIAMLGRSFVRLSIASLAFQIKTKLNTSWAELLLLLLLFLLFCQRVRDYCCCCCCRLICLLQKAIVTRAFDRLLFTPPHTVRVPYTINTLTLTYTIYVPVSMYVFVCVMLCLFFVTVQYFDMFCFYFGLQQQQQFAWPSTLQQSTAWLLSLSLCLSHSCALF